MKKTLTLLLSLAFVSGLWAQAVEVKHGEEIVNEGDTITINASPDDGDLSEHFHVANTSSETIMVQITKEDLSIPEGMTFYFCFDVCYQPGTNTSNRVAIDPETTFYSTLDADLMTNGNEGVALIKMIVNNTSTENDSVAFFVEFIVDDGSGINNLANSNLKLFPNPAKDYLSLEYTGNNNFDKIEMYDAVGKVVKSININSINQTISVSDLANGVYLVMLKNNDAIISTRKVIIE